MKQQMSETEQMEKCLVCSQLGVRRAVEILPDGNTLVMVAHDDGRICKWSEGDLSTAIRPKREHGTSPTVVCSKCKKGGNLHWFYDNNVKQEERLLTFRYYVRHEAIAGTWGKDKLPRYRRCYLNTLDQRIAVLKQVGRYIADPLKPRRRRGRPRKTGGV